MAGKSRPKGAQSRIRKNKLDFSAAPSLNDEESTLLVAAFLSTPEFKANGTFPQIDTAKLAQTANYSTKASANTAWWELRRKLKSLPQNLNVNISANASPAKAAPVTDESVEDEGDQIERSSESDSKSPDQMADKDVPNDARRRSASGQIKAKASKTKAAGAANQYPPGSSTYARHYQGTDMAFAFHGPLNIIYDDEKEQQALFDLDFGGMDFD